MIKLCQWDITGECNLNCSYCREKRTEKLATLKLEQIFSIINQFADMEVKMVNIAGGEPLIFKDLPRVLSYLRPKVETLGLTTNATLVSNKNISIIKDFFDGVQVSLDGGSADIHDLIRGIGMFKKTVSAIELMVKSNVNVMTRLTITHQNKHHIADYIKLASKLGLKSAYLRRIIPSGNSQKTEPLSSDELFNVFKIAHAIGKEFNIHVGSADYFSQIYFDQNEKAKVEKNTKDHPGKVLSGCSIGIDAFYVAQNGQVLFCPYLPVFCGDMTKEHLSSIWEKSKMFKVNRNLRLNIKGKCSKCKYLMCCGGCPAYSFLTAGEITASDAGCWINEQAV